MNAALVGFVRDWMNDYDRDKDKKEQRKYNEAQKAEERAYEASVRQEGRKYQEGRISEGRQYEEGRESTRRTANLEDAKARDEQVYREGLTRFEKIFPSVQQFLPPGYTAEQAYVALGRNGDLPSVERAVTSFTNLQKGLPASEADTKLATNSAQTSEAANRKTVAETVQPKLGEQVRAAQNLNILTSRMGGEEPSRALTSPFYVSVGADGRPLLVENPYKDTLDTKSSALSGMMGANGQLKSIADQLGLEKYPMQFDEFGRPVKRPAPARPTVGVTSTGSTAGATSLVPRGTITPGPERIIPRGYEPYADRLVTSVPPMTEEEKAVVRKTLFDEIVNDYKKRQSAPQTKLYWPE